MRVEVWRVGVGGRCGGWRCGGWEGGDVEGGRVEMWRVEMRKCGDVYNREARRDYN